MNETRFRSLVQELIDENPFAIRAVLKILEFQFTDSIPTLAVTAEDAPRMLVNLGFLEKHCATDRHVKAVVCHEFLHVLLRHTEQKRRMTPARHLALDAVINAIIHRQYGPEYSSMMASYYGRARDLKKLLRPMSRREVDWYRNIRSTQLPQWVHAWDALYQGQLIADDIESLATQIGRDGTGGEEAGRAKRNPFKLEREEPWDPGDLLGNHGDAGKSLPDALEDALEAAMKEMNGAGIWRSPHSRGVGANPYEALFTAKNEPLLRWQRKTLTILKRHLVPDRRSRVCRTEPHGYRIPVLSPGDRRAFFRALWAPSFLPEANWTTLLPKREGTAQVYLDVSGSMNAEMPQIIALLGRLSRYIRRPFWAFSDIVAPALIEQGQLRSVTSGGTSMACVLDHLAITQPASAVIVTDGYIERLDRASLARASATSLHAIVTRDGSPAELRRMGMAYTQLDRVPS